MLTAACCAALPLVLPTTSQAAVQASLATSGAGVALVVAPIDAGDESLVAVLEGEVLRITDGAGLVMAGEGCTAVDAAVTCPAANVRKLLVDLGDGDNSWTSTGISLPVVYRGGAGVDTVRTGAGADTIRPGGGRGTIFGSSGRDRYVIDAAAAASGFIVLSGPDAGIDTLDMSAVSARWIGSRRSGKPWQLHLRGKAAVGVQPSTSVERFLLGRGADDIDMDRFPGTHVTTWRLGVGDDEFQARTSGARTIVDGGLGNDMLASFAASDIMRGGAGHDLLMDFGGRGDQLYGDGGNDSLSSRDGKVDTLNGGAGTDACITLRAFPTLTGCESGDRRTSIERSVKA